MNMFNKQIVLSLLLLMLSSITYSNINRENVPSEEQVAKLAAAAWDEQVLPNSVDITYFLELTTPRKPIKQIRKEVEEMIDQMDQGFYERMGLTKDSLPDWAAKKRKRAIEMNVKLRVKRQQFPRLIKKRIRNVGHNHRSDSVTAEPGEELDPNVPFEHTFVNFGERDSEDFYSFSYHHKLKTASIEDESGWYVRDITPFGYFPSDIASSLKYLLGTNKGTITNPILFPDQNKMQELATTGFARIEDVRGTKVNVVTKIKVTPDPNAPDTRVRLEIGEPNSFPTTVMVCDKDDYSRIYQLKRYNSRTGEAFSIRKCNNFDSQGFPHNVTKIEYDINGNFKEKAVYNIIEVDLNPSIPDEVFEFNPPTGYKIIDNRKQ